MISPDHPFVPLESAFVPLELNETKCNGTNGFVLYIIYLYYFVPLVPLVPLEIESKKNRKGNFRQRKS